ncbi:putative mhyt domain signaling protein [Neofusicoccum parvum UCRNP2]|uniref:Putative mhyt domain signaling protein n=1 Tax=Botryosphaeria parva (strain UCR-NP2) TaxID=1287680 RepID=R1EUT7_BOTPV|nr:putative mhyt domain signaling protein [Neofusicoccum parvum UCRNP2]
MTSITDPTSKYRVGDSVPFHVVPGIIVASWFVSFIGSIATVELLHRRRSGQGWINWLQLGACSVSFGVVGIWCMHFVGNRALELGDGSKEIQLYYSPGFTALSVFLPVVFLFVGFYVAERFNRTRRSLYLSLGITGIFAGLAIVGMHYIGNFGTTTYHLDNDPRYIIGAALIATFSCYVAITLFFHQREQWINTWARRFPVAAILATAVCGMHWTAAAGTRYRLKEFYHGQEQARNNNLIVAISLHVVLASATFDPDGKILVTQEGLLPCQKITRKYNQRSFNDEFNVAHPVFQWIFRVTHNWDSVVDLIGTMRQHLRAVGSLRDPSTPASRGKSSPHEKIEGPQPEVDYSIIFREHFCVAAAELAANMGTTIQKLGTLWEEILMTGTTAAEIKTKSLRRTSKAPPDDMEAGLTIPAPALFGRGQLLFVVRELQKEECADLIASGYSWDVLVTRDEPFHLPKINILPEAPNDAMLSFLNYLDNRTIADFSRYINGGLNAQKSECRWTDEEAAFAEKLRDGIKLLQTLIPEHFFRQAVFTSRPLRDYTVGTSSRLATIFSFCIIPDVHMSSIKSPHLMYTPLSFFRCRQHIHRGSPDHAVLAHSIHREFNEIRAHQQKEHGQKMTKAGSIGSALHANLSRQSSGVPRFGGGSGRGSPGGGSRTKHGGFKAWLGGMSGGNSRRDSGLQPDSASERELVSMGDMLKRVSDESSRDQRNHSIGGFVSGGGGGGLGGIMVSQDIRIDDDQKEDSVLEMTDMGIRSEAGQGGKEEETFADQLFEITSTRLRRG